MTALLGRQAVLTGASGGIGAAIARELMAQGATVHGIDCDPDGLDALAQEFSGRFLPYRADLADRSATDRMLGPLHTVLAGRCDILVNNAGIARVQAFVSTEDALLDRLLAVNFTAVFRVTRALVPALRASGRASVINIASELALIGQPGYTAYTATKGAILAFSRALAIELAADGIRVNAVCPGPIDTPMLAGEFTVADDPVAARAAEIASVPLGRLGVPGDIAAVVAFLASDAAGFVTGAAWPVDGGKTAR
ncbi:MAG TPA: SDR family NAD(P)-dependent oxidoreductase [Steroidobacteraceae bacterium]|nr:SDR family NAD(P)-dependent oxidoreductase [Steroidobacteraceae bacterium]